MRSKLTHICRDREKFGGALVSVLAQLPRERKIDNHFFSADRDKLDGIENSMRQLPNAFREA